MTREIRSVCLSLPQETYKQVAELADQMGVSKSEIVRTILEQYVASERRWQQIRKWGEETAKSMSIKDRDDIDRIIHESREEKIGS